MSVDRTACWRKFRYGDDDLSLSQVDQLSVLSFGSGGGGDDGPASSAFKMEMEVLRMENQRLENELHAVRMNGAAATRDLQARCVAAEQRATAADAAREKDMHRHEVEMAREREKHAQAMADSIRSRKHEFQGEQDLARENLASLQSQFTPLRLSVERYAEIKSQPVDTLPFKEWLQLQVHNNVYEASQQLERARGERDELQAALAANQESVIRATRETEQTKATLLAREQSFAESTTAAEEELSMYRREATSATARFQQVAADAAVYDETKAELKSLKLQTSELAKERDDALAKYEALAATASNASAVQQQLDLVKMDKAYLTREVDNLKQRVHRAEEAADAAEPQLEALKNEKQQLYDRLLAVREEISGGLDRRVEEELQRLRQKSELDIQSANSHARDLFERENLVLREARDTAKEEAERQTVALRQSNEANTQLEIDYRTLVATTESQLSDLRNRLKMKSFEHERVAVDLEHTKDSNRQIKLEAERWQQKCAVLKEEFYVLKTESATRVTELEARSSTQAKQLEHYELIEAELDNAILSGRSSEATEMGNTMVTSAKRRVHQALGLAQQVTALRTEKNELVTQLAAIQTANQKLKEASNSHSQPFSLLVS